MSFINYELRGWRWSVLLVLAAAVGCSRLQSNEQRIQKAFEVAGQKPTRMFPVAGTATIDGEPPQFTEPNKCLLVVLYDPDKPDLKAQHAVVRTDGKFAFQEDGVAPGHYVLLFAALKKKGKWSFNGPDELGNLYNDPDANAKIHPEFVLDHKAPGETDLKIDLQVSGKPPVTKPGPHAVTKYKF